MQPNILFSLFSSSSILAKGFISQHKDVISHNYMASSVLATTEDKFWKYPSSHFPSMLTPSSLFLFLWKYCTVLFVKYDHILYRKVLIFSIFLPIDASDE